jgi:hypothetical protein
MLPVLFLALGCTLLASSPSSAGDAEQKVPISVRIEPNDLAAMLQKGPAPLVLQVGSKVLFDEAHIVGAQYAGPAGQPEGLQNLKTQVDKHPRDRLIVIYCGCCPWERCPNIGPAYKELNGMGFTNVKVLHLLNNFGEDWVDKGLPVQRG